MVKGLFVSYPGEPINPTTFLPDNGLASLAATLIDEGDEALILDYGTIEQMERCYPKDIRDRLKEIFQKRMDNALSEDDNDELITIDKILDKHRKKMIIGIGKDIVDKISKHNMDFVGFKTWMGDAYPALIDLSTIIKEEFPNLPILAGGPQVLSFTDQMLANVTNIDYFCYDEGEITIKAFSEYLKGKRSINQVPNILYREGHSIKKNEHVVVDNLDLLPLPNYDSNIYPSAISKEKFRMIVLDESRRCYFHCPFCIETSKEKTKWRAKSFERIIEEIKNVYEKSNVKLIRFGGQMTPGILLEKISDILIKEELNIEFSSFSHISTMKQVDFSKLRKAGLYSLFFGVESGSQKMLSGSLGKKVRVNEIEEVLKKASDSGIYTVASIIYPSPGDTNETMEETVNLLKRTGIRAAPVQFAGVYPKTTWARYPEKYGFELNTKTYADEIIDYKIKNIFPPKFWNPLPVKISGKSFSEYIQETGKMIFALEEEGILTDITDEQALLAKYSGMSPLDFRNTCREIFYTGNAEKMHDIVDRVNSK